MLEEAKKQRERMITDRRYFHQHPEVGYDLDQTRTYIKQCLTEMGLTPEICGDGGVTALIGEGSPCVLLRADMDALPMREESHLPFASTLEQAHTCGHDLHMAMLLGAARILTKKRLSGSVKLLFQPAEEDGSGAINMIDHGILKNPQVDASFGMHVYSWPSSHVYFRPEVQMPGNDFFTITIKGQSAHGSAPHLGIDPIAIAAHLIVNVQMLHARMIDAKERFVVTFGQMTAGSAPNIIPDEAVLKGTIRTYDSEIREKIISHFQTIVRETAAMFQGEAELTFDMSVPVLYNDPTITSLLGEAFSRILPEDHVHPEIPPLSISDDFSHFGLRIPSVYVLLGAGMADYPAYSLHDARIVFDEEAMVTGCMLYVQAALTILDAYKK